MVTLSCRDTSHLSQSTYAVCTRYATIVAKAQAAQAEMKFRPRSELHESKLSHRHARQGCVGDNQVLGFNYRFAFVCHVCSSYTALIALA